MLCSHLVCGALFTPFVCPLVHTVCAPYGRSRESYVRRERAYKTRIDELEDALQKIKTDKTSWMTHEDNMTSLRSGIDSMHDTIQSNVDMVQDRTTKILQEQERDLLRAFRARLFDVQTELDKEKKSTDDGATKWIEENKQMAKQLDWYKDNNDRLDSRNQALKNENDRLKSNYQTQEKDRNYLIQSLVDEKRRAARLHQECEKAEKENTRMQKIMSNGKKSGMGMTLDSLDFNSTAAPGGRPAGRPGTTGGMGSLMDGGADTRYKEIIKRLKRLLETERRNLAQARERYVMEVRQRTEMEVLLRDAVEDVRGQIKAKKRGANRQNIMEHHGADSRKQSILGTAHGAGIAVDDFTSEDRERVLELLFAKERVISLLQAKAFPPQTKVVGGEAAPSKEEIDAIYNGKELFDPNKSRPATSNEAVGGVGALGALAGGAGGSRPGTAGA